MGVRGVRGPVLINMGNAPDAINNHSRHVSFQGTFRAACASAKACSKPLWRLTVFGLQHLFMLSRITTSSMPGGAVPNGWVQDAPPAIIHLQNLAVLLRCAPPSPGLSTADHQPRDRMGSSGGLTQVFAGSMWDQLEGR